MKTPFFLGGGGGIRKKNTDVDEKQFDDETRRKGGKGKISTSRTSLLWRKYRIQKAVFGESIAEDVVV